MNFSYSILNLVGKKTVNKYRTPLFFHKILRFEQDTALRFEYTQISVYLLEF